MSPPTLPPNAPLPRSSPAPEPLGHAGRLIALLCVSAFLILSFWNFGAPGLDDDEAVIGVTTGWIDLSPILHSFSFSHLPLMGYSNHAAMMCYWIFPFFKLLNTPFLALRLSSLLFGLAALLLTFQLSRRLFGRSVALLTLGLLAVHPNFLIGSRLGAHHGILLCLFSTSSLLFFHRWWTDRRGSDFGLGFLCLGLGLSTFTYFLFWIGAIAATALLFAKKLFPPFRARWKTLCAAGIVSFSVGAWPLLAAFHRQGMAEKVLEYISSSEQSQSRLTTFAVFSPRKSFRVLGDLLTGADLRTAYWNDVSFWDFHARAASYLLALALAFFWISRRSLFDKKHARPPASALGLLSVIFFDALLNSYQPSGKYGDHFLHLLPIVLLFTAAGLGDLFNAALRPGTRALGLALAGGGLALSAMTVNVEYLFYLQKTGGVDFASGAVHDLADWVQVKGYRSLVENEPPRLTMKLWFLTSKKFETQQFTGHALFGQAPRNYPSPAENFDALILDWKKSGRSGHALSPSALKNLSSWRDARGRKLKLAAVFREKHGRPAYLVYEPRPPKQP
ncbi:MAG TPA: glycosyltransferase family 39 protein [Elusimicrobiota bacterium]|nr:glycosyltransferase family 39 protein [Elusimicrobiota bacterium]